MTTLKVVMSHLESKSNQWQDWGVMGVGEKKIKQKTMLAPIENSSKVIKQHQPTRIDGRIE